MNPRLLELLTGVIRVGFSAGLGVIVIITNRLPFFFLAVVLCNLGWCSNGLGQSHTAKPKPNHADKPPLHLSEGTWGKQAFQSVYVCEAQSDRQTHTEPINAASTWTRKATPATQRTSPIIQALLGIMTWAIIAGIWSWKWRHRTREQRAIIAPMSVLLSLPILLLLGIAVAIATYDDFKARMTPNGQKLSHGDGGVARETQQPKSKP